MMGWDRSCDTVENKPTNQSADFALSSAYIFKFPNIKICFTVLSASAQTFRFMTFMSVEKHANSCKHEY